MDPLFDAYRIACNQARATAHRFLDQELAALVAERLPLIARQFTRTLHIGAPLPDASVDQHLVRLNDAEVLEAAPASYDRITFAGVLHLVNDLPGVLVQINHALQPDGLFIGAFLGGDTLWQLRRALMDAESEIKAGAAQRVAPFVDVRDGGALLQRAGFSMPVADSERWTFDYADMFSLLADLRGQGEGNPLLRVHPLSRKVLLRAAELYHARHCAEAGRVEASFTALTLTGWAPGSGQPKPLRPGTGKISLAEVLRPSQA
jgi:NADH dehydrogenase [ubiquinone] 1 alpha subcomplex assembly factor 5